jgi:4'-phosphopantetheinyl transferase
MFEAERNAVRLLSVVRGSDRLLAALALTVESGLPPGAQGFLCGSEATYFANLKVERRRRSYLLGRYAAKLAVGELIGQLDLQQIEIRRGVFEQPIVVCPDQESCGVSISHSHNMAIALAFPLGHPMGIDLERLELEHYSTLQSQLSADEMSWVQSAGSEKLELATALWTAKEALAKVLGSGMMSPIHIYSLAEFHLLGVGSWEGTFENFAQYKSLTWVGSASALSIVLPKRSNFGCELNIQAEI